MRTEKTSVLLEEAAVFLEDLVLPKNASFDMGHYGLHPAGPEPKLNNLCGTSGCAAGWLSLSPTWRERGFKSLWKKHPGRDWMLSPYRFSTWDGMGKAVFGTTAAEIHDIFMMVCSTRRSVAKAFRRLSKEYQNKGE